MVSHEINDVSSETTSIKTGVILIDTGVRQGEVIRDCIAVASEQILFTYDGNWTIRLREYWSRDL